MTEKATRHTPVILTMVIANRVEKDPASGKHNILGTYDSIRASAFPALHPSFSLFVELTDGRGPTALSLRLVDIDQERDPVFEAPEEVFDLKDPTQAYGIAINIPHILFPEPGDYVLQLFSGDELLRERRIHLNQAPATARPTDAPSRG
jgi:hypothetical protein